MGTGNREESGEKRVDARGVGVRGKGRGEWDGDWEESDEKRVGARGLVVSGKGRGE
jgi:hypothetical protein